MADDLMRARESFYRRFVVVATGLVGHLVILLSCLALMLVGKAPLFAVAVFVAAHLVLIGLFLAAWGRLKAVYPDTLPAADLEARGDVVARGPFERRRREVVAAFGTEPGRDNVRRMRSALRAG